MTVFERTCNILGVFEQPAEVDGVIAKWAALGVTHFWGCPEGHDPKAWAAAIKAAGLQYCPWFTDGYDVNDKPPYVMLTDEPEDKDVTVASLLAQVATIHSQGLKAFVNVDGWQYGNNLKPDFDYATLFKACDGICLDNYYANGGQMATMAFIQAEYEKLRAANPAADLFGYLECSDQDNGQQEWAQQAYINAAGNVLGPIVPPTQPPPGYVSVASRMRAPTTAEFWQQATIILTLGGTCILFPQVPNDPAHAWPADFDGTVQSLKLEIKNLSTMTSPPLPQPTPAPNPVDPAVTALQTQVKALQTQVTANTAAIHSLQAILHKHHIS